MGPKFWELIILLAIVVLLFGPNRLAGVGEAVGKAIIGSTPKRWLTSSVLI